MVGGDKGQAPRTGRKSLDRRTSSPGAVLSPLGVLTSWSRGRRETPCSDMRGGYGRASALCTLRGGKKGGAGGVQASARACLQPPVPAVGDPAHKRNDWTLGWEANERFAHARGEWWEPGTVQAALDSTPLSSLVEDAAPLTPDQQRPEQGRTWRTSGVLLRNDPEGTQDAAVPRGGLPDLHEWNLQSFHVFCSVHGRETLFSKDRPGTTNAEPRSLCSPSALESRGEPCQYCRACKSRWAQSP